MDCLGCGKRLVIPEDLMTYYQSQTGIHLALKPEKKADLKNLSKNLKFVQDGKEIRLACVNCDRPAGKEVPIGPNGCRVISFGIDKVIVNVDLLTRSRGEFCMDFLFLFMNKFTQ